jgi:uncharacterized membrane protein YjjP (DUF1212 family)
MTRPTYRINRQPIGRTLAMPVLLAVASVTGLVLALTGDGWRDLLSAFLLILPLVATAFAWARRG